MSTLTHQPIINIGCLGSVSDGKSTLVEKLTGTQTQRHSTEKTRNITKNQGYANMKIWLDTSEDGSTIYHTTDTHPTEYKNENGKDCQLVNHVSFVDCPGHQELIKVMLSSIALMDGAVVVVAVNDKAPSEKPQLIQHLAAIKLGRIDKIIICLNKIDLVSKDLLLQRKQELDEMLEQYNIRPYAVIPTCFNKKIGMKYVLQAMMELFNPTNFTERDSKSPIFYISRSFDIMKPGTNWTDITGGVIGGSLMSGKIRSGDEIEIRPGMLMGKQPGKISCKPIKTTVFSIKTDTTELDEICPGGLIGIRTDADPVYCKANYLTGNVAGLVGTLPNVYLEITMNVRMVTMFGYTWEPKVKDVVSIQIGTHMADASVKSVSDKIVLTFSSPVCIPDNQHIIICRTIDSILRIVAEGCVLYSENPNFLPMV